MTLPLFSAGYAWGDDDGVADAATPVSTSRSSARTVEKVGNPDLSRGGVATVAGVAIETGASLAARLSQPAVARSATTPATPGLADFRHIEATRATAVADVASVAAWRDGVASMTRLIGMSPPYYGGNWRQLFRDARRFLDDWGADAERLGWSTLDVFGSNPSVSHRRLDRVGLVALLEGNRVQQMDADSALIGHGRDVLTYRRTPRAAGSVPIWMMRAWQ